MVTDRKALTHPKYRPDIDGLRALAVLSVLEFHVFPNRLVGGLVGVDVFFVISGYLISTIILENLSSGTFSFLEFYARRVRRIFPALLVILVACFSVGWVYLFSDEYKQLGKHIASGSLFITNFVLWNEAGYFDVSSMKKPLLHLWSLGVEDQFYIVWPLLLWFSYRRNLNQITFMVLVLILSFCMNISATGEDSVKAFYSPQTRFWELLFGGVIAWNAVFYRGGYVAAVKKLNKWIGPLIYRKCENEGEGSLANVSSFLGSIFLIYGFTQIKGGSGFPGAWALIPVLGASLIILAGPSAWINRNILSQKLMVWFGLISYPLYLWHWPIISFAHILTGKDALSNAVSLAAILLSIILAWLTFILVERPIRKHAGGKATVILVLMMIFVGGSGYYLYRHDGAPLRNKKVNTIALAAGDWRYPGDLKPYVWAGKRLLRQNSSVGSITLFVGDSNVEQYYPRVDALIRRDGNKFNSAVFVTGGGCLVLPHLSYDEAHKHCFGIAETALAFARRDKMVNNVVIAEQWNGYLSGGFGLVGDFRIKSKDYMGSLANLSAYIKEYRQAGKNVFVVLNIPTGPEFDPKYMLQRNLASLDAVFTVREGGLKRGDIDSRYLEVQNDIRGAVEAAGGHVISPMDYLCSKEFCPSLDSSDLPMYKDAAHLGPRYVSDSVEFIDQAMLPNRGSSAAR